MYWPSRHPFCLSPFYIHTMSYCALTFVDTSFHACAGLDMDFCLSLVCLYMHVPPFPLVWPFSEVYK